MGTSTRSHIALAGLILLGAAPAAPPAPEGLAADSIEQIEAFVRATMRQDRVPGLSLAIVNRDSVLYARGFGESCRGEASPVEASTAFVLGSMSKSFTALAIMQQVERGKLDLDAPVTRYLPWFRVADESASGAITARHLLHHTSGIPRWATAGEDASLDAHVRALAAAELPGAPGGQHHYASPNYQVLGRIVEQLSGQPFGDYIRERIFTPLGMMGSRIAVPGDSEGAGMACGHRYWLGFPIATRLPHETGRLPTASLISSAEDLARYLMALLGGGSAEQGSMLSPAGMRALFTPGATTGESAYAMGWRKSAIRGVPAIHHGGHLYHFRGKMVLLPDDERGIVVLTNASSMLGRTTSHMIADGIVGLLAQKRPGSPGLPLKWVLTALGIVMALLSFGLVREALALRRWSLAAAEQLRAGGNKRAKLGLSVAWGLALPPAILVGLPLFLHLDWPEMLRAMPDLSWWMLIYMPAAFVLGLSKARAVLRLEMSE